MPYPYDSAGLTRTAAPDAVTAVTGLLVITNAAAGSADRAAVDAAIDVLRQGADVRVISTSTPDDCQEAVRERAGRRVVVCGGDGSVHVVASALQKADDLADPVGVIPLGTGNDLARTVGIPLDPAEAARVVLTGSPCELDLLVDDTDDVVVNAAHLGVGAAAAVAVTRLKPRLGKLAYVVGGIVAGIREQGWRGRVEVDGETLVDGQRLLQVAIGLGRSVGGGSPLMPEAVLRDGLADVVVSTAVGPIARLRYGLRMRRGEHLDRPDVVAVRGRRVVVSGEPFSYNADGEVHGPVQRREWTIDPAGWRLIGPRRSVARGSAGSASSGPPAPAAPDHGSASG
jgi:YegS/Rv2252/BmrU family lipid kinase